MRIAILNPFDRVVAHIDNDVPEALHYYDDTLHTYLAGSQYTFEFKIYADMADSKYIVAGNKLGFKYKDKEYYLNIVSVDGDNRELNVVAYGLSLQLSGNTISEYKADKSYSFKEYLAKFDSDNVVKLGINEISDRSRKLDWDGESTLLARLFSLATKFNAEIEFITNLNDDYSLKEITLNVYRKHSDTVQGIGTDHSAIVLRDLFTINRTVDIKDLYTAIFPTGKDGLNLISMAEKTEKDDAGNTFIKPTGSNIIYAQTAMNSFPNHLKSMHAKYIVKSWSTDYATVEALYGNALAELKKNCTPKVSYTIDGYVDGEIGDTYTIEDKGFNSVQYIRARIIEQQICTTDVRNSKTVFDNFTEISAKISNDVLKQVQALIDANKNIAILVSSSNGTIFNESDENKKTTLTARLLDGQTDVTDKYRIMIYRDGTYVKDGPNIELTVSGKTIIRFDAIGVNEVVVGSYELTIGFTKNGKDAVQLKIISTAQKYQLSDDGNNTPAGEWLDTKPTFSKEYIWTMVTHTYSDGSSTSFYLVEKRPRRMHQSTQYYLSTSAENVENGEWSDTEPDMVIGKYMWSRHKLSYSDGSVEYSTEWRNDQINKMFTTIQTLSTNISDTNGKINLVVQNAQTLIDNRIADETQRIKNEYVTKTDFEVANGNVATRFTDIENGVEKITSLIENTPDGTRWKNIAHGDTETLMAADGQHIFVAGKEVASFTANAATMQALKVTGDVQMGAHLIQRGQHKEITTGKMVASTDWYWIGGE
nr:MAG TPA: tail protein [Caudoviricetes sp.]